MDKWKRAQEQEISFNNRTTIDFDKMHVFEKFICYAKMMIFPFVLSFCDFKLKVKSKGIFPIFWIQEVFLCLMLQNN